MYGFQAGGTHPTGMRLVWHIYCQKLNENEKQLD